VGVKEGYPHKRSLFYRCWLVYRLQIDIDLLLTVIITADKFFYDSTLMTLNDLEPPGILVIFLQFSAAAHTSTVECNEMDGDKPGRPANNDCCIGCRASHDLCSNYFL